MATKKRTKETIIEDQSITPIKSSSPAQVLGEEDGGQNSTNSTTGPDVNSTPQQAAGRGRKKPARKKEVAENLVDDGPVEKPAIEKSRPRRKVSKKAEDTSSAEDQAEIGQEPKKRPGRKKKTEDIPPSASADVEILADVVIEEFSEEESDPANKPARKRSPRKRRAPKEPEVADVPPISQVEELEPATPEAGDQNAAEEKETVPTEQKRTGSGRRSRRGKRSQRRDSGRVADQEAKAGSEEDLSEGAGRGSQEQEQQGRQSSRSSAYTRAEEFGEEDEGDDFATFHDEEDEGFSLDEVPEPENVPRPVCKLLINAEEPEECRLALLENGRLESIHVSTVNRTQTKNNIYKARIVAIEPSLQAAFVDYGTEKNGFLPFSEIHPEYFRQDLSNEVQKNIEAQNWKKLSISDVVERGQEVLVQVVKEEVGKKGANMTTYLSLPGRCVVLMPGSDSSGISRKISGEERRSQLREAMNSIDIPEGIGWIVRTASGDTTQEALSRDVTYLLRLWDEIKKKGQDLEGVGMVYEDQHSVLRFLREHFDPSIEEILVDDRTALEQVKAFVDLLPSKQKTVKVRLHKGARPIFNQYSIEDQIESIYQSKVNLPSGGSIVIDPTEALVAIDVNSGSTSKGKNFEASIFQANMEAASELARQLRLRDLGGLIVVDFIDMRSKKNIREVERQVKISMKRDKAKVDISRISKFGLMQISRQKLGAPIEAGNYRVCEHCKGRGMVRSVETLALFYLRRIQTGASRKNVVRVECHFPLDVAHYLLNNKRHELQDMETRYNTEIVIVAETSMRPADNDIIFHKAEKEVGTQNQA